MNDKGGDCMKLKAFAPALLGAVAAFSMVPAMQVSAAETMLTVSQMRALIGDTLPGQYFDGTDYQACTFNYYDACTFTGWSSGGTNLGMAANSTNTSETALGTPTYTSYYGLVYKMNLSGNPISNNVQYLTCKLQPVIQLSDLYEIRFFAGFSAENKTSSSNITFANSGNVDITSNEGIRYYTDISGESTLTNARISSYYNYGSYKCITCNFLTSEQNLYASFIGLRRYSESPFSFQMRYDSSCGITQRGGIGANKADGTSEQMGIYFYISTMYLSDSYTDTGSGDYGDSSSGSGGDGGTPDLSGVISRLDQIITILNQIASAQGLDITIPDSGDTSNVNSLSSGMDSASQAAADNQAEINSAIDYNMSLDIAENEYSYPDQFSGILDLEDSNGDIIKSLLISMMLSMFGIALLAYIIFGRAS